MSNLQTYIQDKGKGTSSKRDQNLKRKRCEDDSADSTDSEPSPKESIDNVNFEIDNEEIDDGKIDIKYELMEYDSTDADPPADSQDGDMGLEESVVDVIKTEPEDDPLLLSKGSNEFPSKLEETTQENLKCCDEGFIPGTGDNLPQVDALSVTEFFALFPNHDKEQIRAIWRQPSEQLDDSIGYVQIKRDGKKCTVKCQVATKTKSNHCTIVYSYMCYAVQTASCDCGETLCSHAVSALIWLSQRERGPATYWMMPMVSRDASSMKLNSIFGLPKISYQKKYTILDEFVKKCAEKELFSPVLMKYHQNEKPKASMHRLMGEYRNKCNRLDIEVFLDFCQKNLLKDPLVKLNMLVSPKVMQELEYGRITDALLLDVCQATDDGVEDLVQKIMYPKIKEPVTVNYGISHSLELSLKMKIRKCSLILSHTSPIFSSSPYGITHTHVIYIKKLEDADINMFSKSTKKLSQKDIACMQLQMFLAKKKSACYCEVLSDNQIVISILNYNEQWLIELLMKATNFWQRHVLKCIKRNSNK